VASAQQPPLCCRCRVQHVLCPRCHARSRPLAFPGRLQCPPYTLTTCLRQDVEPCDNLSATITRFSERRSKRPCRQVCRLGAHLRHAFSVTRARCGGGDDSGAVPDLFQHGTALDRLRHGRGSAQRHTGHVSGGHDHRTWSALPAQESSRRVAHIFSIRRSQIW
jgi:hypothetical protein